ncbi:MAG: glycerol-3-phosphate 1-O-acyltransferase PlsY [Candidatus Palauibacterales bacterium]|nr:glycerol-3-phosphate 1-O-acyltransferase PlsY [Candidatus Palauibacterales bacterium]
MTIFLLAASAYLMGSIPTSYLVGRMRGIDLRQHGSGNLGGTNAYRVMGAAAGLPVVAVDVAKGFIPTYFFPAWDGSAFGDLALLYGLAAIAGHVWSVFVGFRGGKGVATGAGVLVALAPTSALIGLLVWVGVVSITRYVSVASLAAATIVPLSAWLTDEARSTVLFCAAIAIFVWWTHRGNLRRLSRGQENRFGRTPGPSDFSGGEDTHGE